MGYVLHRDNSDKNHCTNQKEGDLSDNYYLSVLLVAEISQAQRAEDQTVDCKTHPNTLAERVDPVL